MKKQYLLVRIGIKDFVIDMKNLWEITRCQEVVEGKINLRGNLIPVISFAENNLSNEARMVIVNNKDNNRFSFIVDSVLKVSIIEDEKIITLLDVDNVII